MVRVGAAEGRGSMHSRLQFIENGSEVMKREREREGNKRGRNGRERERGRRREKEAWLQLLISP